MHISTICDNSAEIINMAADAVRIFDHIYSKYLQKNTILMQYRIKNLSSQSEKLNEIYKIILKFYLLLSKFFYHKTMKYESNTIQLLTLIIDREYYKKKISLDLRDKTIDNFHQAYVKKKQATKIIASFPTKNVAAAKYYSRNNFNIFLKNKLYNFIEKKYGNLNKYW